MTLKLRSVRRTASAEPPPVLHPWLQTIGGAALVLAIMSIGSLILWAGTPLLWLWVGSRVQGASGSLGLAVAVMFAGAVTSVVLLAVALVELSELHRANRRARGFDDRPHAVLENVLVVSAGVTLAVFGLWFFLFAGANPVPLGIQI